MVNSCLANTVSETLMRSGGRPIARCVPQKQVIFDRQRVQAIKKEHAFSVRRARFSSRNGLSRARALREVLRNHDVFAYGLL